MTSPTLSARASDLQALLDRQRPASVLSLTNEPDLDPALVVYRALALDDLDRSNDARAVLEPALPLLAGDDLARATCAWAALLLDSGDSDGAIRAAEDAARVASDPLLRAAGLGWAARGYAHKRCWGLARDTVRQALELAPGQRTALAAQARVALDMDDRMAARAAYERLAVVDRAVGAWGLASVAYLLGEFAPALVLLEEAIASDEVIGPLFLRVHIAYVTRDLALLEASVALIARRSPEAEALPALQSLLADLRAQLAASEGRSRVQLAAFPTTMQRRNYCGPCTVELVLRYWREGIDITNDQIARAIKDPGGGTPIYRMREYFHLLGFDTLRCRASVGQIKRIIDAGLPVIVEERFANSSHVTVVIGYDEEAGTLLFQDPMTHALTTLPIETVNQLRRFVCNAALVAFPADQGYQRTLALMDLYDDQALVWMDQAALAFDEGRYDETASLARSAVQRLPSLELGWVTWLLAELRRWSPRAPTSPYLPGSLAARLDRPDEVSNDGGERITAVLEAAMAACDSSEVRQLAGQVALRNGDPAAARAALEQALAQEPTSAYTHALLAECHVALRADGPAREAAARAIQLDPSLPAANVWMARCSVRENAAQALHFARCAADLAPEWWLAQLTLAEAQHAHSDIDAMRTALGKARMLAPHEPLVAVAHATWLSGGGEMAAAAAELEALLDGRRALTPALAYAARQSLCRILFGARLFDAALAQIEPLLAQAPDDPWALQFRAAAGASARIATGEASDQTAIAEVQASYAVAIRANDGSRAVVYDYAEYLAALAGPDAAADAVAELRTAYPERSLAAIHGAMAERAGRAEEAAAAMLDALGEAGAFDDLNALGHAIAVALAGMGVEAGAAAVLGAPEQVIPLATRERLLGMVLSEYEDQAERARELLRRSLAGAPDDAATLIRLGDVAESDDERGQCYRRALVLTPGWAFARGRLARLLARQERWVEVLELTSGYTSDALELTELYGRALLRLGRFEESADSYAQLVGQLAAPPDWVLYYTWLAQKRAGRHAEAIATGQMAAQRFPDDPDWFVRIALTLVAAGAHDDALEAVRAGRSSGLPEEAEHNIAYAIALADHDPRRALEIARRGRALEEETPQGELSMWEYRIVRHLAEIGHEDDARALAADRDLTAKGWGYAAWELCDAKSWELVREFAEQALARDETSYPGLFSYAVALRELGCEDEARAGYERLRQAHPDEHNSYEKLALLLAIEGQTDAALVQAEHAVALGAFCHLAWATRGYVAFVRGERDRALADFDAAWTRADVDGRRDEHIFWWIRAALRGEEETAARERELAIAEAVTQFSRGHIAQVEALLRG